MNFLNRFRYAIGLVPKFPKMEFDEKYCLLSPAKPKATVTLENKISIGHNAALLRFSFRNDDLILGTKIGQYVHLGTSVRNQATNQLEQITRPFVPISEIDEMGVVDFLVRFYKADEKTNFKGGDFSKALENLNVNDTIEISGPSTNYVYNGMGSFDLNINNQIKSIEGIRFLGLIASGNGITAFFQLLEAIARSRIDKTNISLLYVNKQYKDMLLLEELVSFHDQNKIQLTLQLQEPETYWPGLTGEVKPEILQDTLPPPGPETLIMGCVAQQHKEKLTAMLKELGYTDEMIFLM